MKKITSKENFILYVFCFIAILAMGAFVIIKFPEAMTDVLLGVLFFTSCIVLLFFQSFKENKILNKVDKVFLGTSIFVFLAVIIIFLLEKNRNLRIDGRFIVGIIAISSIIILSKLFKRRASNYANQKEQLKKMTPLIFLGIGVTITLASLLFEGTFDPFVLFAFILAFFLELLFRKQKRIPSNILSIVFCIILTLSLKLFVIDILVMKSDAMEPRIQKNSRIFYMPHIYKLFPGDLVVYKLNSSPKQYIGEITSLKEPNRCEITRVGIHEQTDVSRDQIRGKIIGIIGAEQKK